MIKFTHWKGSILFTGVEFPPPTDAPFSCTSGVEVLNPSVAVNVLPEVVPGVAIDEPAVAAV